MKKSFLLFFLVCFLLSSCRFKPDSNEITEESDSLVTYEIMESIIHPTVTEPPVSEPETEAETEPETEAQPGLPTLSYYQYSNLISFGYPVRWIDTSVIDDLVSYDEVEQRIEEDYERTCGFLPYKDCWYKWNYYNPQIPPLYYYIRACGITREQFVTEYARLLAEQIEQGGDGMALRSYMDDEYLIYGDEDLDILFGDYSEEAFKTNFKNDLAYYYDGVLYCVRDLMYLGMIGGYDDLLRDMAINGGLIEHLEFFADPPYRILDFNGEEYDKSRIWNEYEAVILGRDEYGNPTGEPIRSITLREFYVKVKALAKT